MYGAIRHFDGAEIAELEESGRGERAEPLAGPRRGWGRGAGVGGLLPTDISVKPDICLKSAPWVEGHAVLFLSVWHNLHKKVLMFNQFDFELMPLEKT